jgi:hypothetical protein
MKKFLIKSGLFLLLFLLCVELISRLFIDPLYFHSLNTYNIVPPQEDSFEAYKLKETRHIDYLFIGSSRVAATINPSVIMRKDTNLTVVVAGRGYMTEGIHYQALKNNISKYPDYLKNAKVFLEYYGSDVYSGSFDENRLRIFEPLETNEAAMPQLLLPHLDSRSLLAFLKESHNSKKIKVQMVLLYCISSYRTIPFIKEKFENIINRLNVDRTEQQLVKEGGIRSDNIEKAKKWAIDIAAIQAKEIQKKPLLTFDDLDKSSLAFMNDLIVNSGGKLYLYKMPLCSVQEASFKCDRAIQNKKIFEQWVFSKGIPIIYNKKFNYQDSDFPDTWHLGADRRDEFTLMLFHEIVNTPAKISHNSGISRQP